jgi:hypothetical protein
MSRIIRVGGVPSAIALIEETIAWGEPDVQEKGSIDLARLYFDQGVYHKVADLLSRFYEEGHPIVPDERQELFGRILLTISLLSIGEVGRARRQMGRLTYLSTTSDAPGANPLVAALFRSFEP